MEHSIDRASYRRQRNNVAIEKPKQMTSYEKIFVTQIVISTILVFTIVIIKVLNIEPALNWIEQELNKEIDTFAIYEFGQNKIEELFKMEINGQQKEEIKSEEIKQEEPNILCISTNVSTEPIYETAVEGVNQLLDDASYIKENYNLIHPIIAPVSSWFGVRESLNPIVTKYHSGIDLAANTGTKIKAALSGKVVKASSSGAYGKHLIIKTDDILLVYAHCSKLNVKNGATVKQGDVIAEVGSTGAATGPHLHFEIRMNDRLINPADILEFKE